MMHHAPRSRRVRRVVATTCLLLASFSPLANAQSGAGYTGSDSAASPETANSDLIDRLLRRGRFRTDPLNLSLQFGTDFGSVVLVDWPAPIIDEGLYPIMFSPSDLGFSSIAPIVIFRASTLTKVGAFTPDANGQINANIAIPASLEAGDHHLFFKGVDPTGTARVVGLEFKVAGVSANRLALTGSNPSNLVAIGGLLIVVGVAGTAAARRRMQAAPAVQSNNSTR